MAVALLLSHRRCSGSWKRHAEIFANLRRVYIDDGLLRHYSVDWYLVKSRVDRTSDLLLDAVHSG